MYNAQCTLNIVHYQTPLMVSSKNIIILSPAHPLRGGIAASTERLAQELQFGGHRVHIYSFSLQYPAFLFPGKTQFTDDPAPAGLSITTCLNSINPLNWVLSARSIARQQPDQVIVRFWLPFLGPCLGTVLRLLPVFSRKKIRRTALVDNLIPHEKRPGDRLFSRYFTGACDDFVVMSHSVGQDIAQFLPERRKGRHIIRFAPHPVYDNYGDAVPKSAARSTLGLPAAAPVVLFFGFIRAYKGLDLLLEALRDLPDVHAVVAGECYGDWSVYEALIEAGNMQDRVHVFSDFIPADQVKYYFSAADLAVQPYKSATQSGISQIAYHFGTPMVVTNVGGLAEIVPDGKVGFVVEPNATAVRDAIRRFFDEGHSQGFKAAIEAEKQRFSWANLVSVLLLGNVDRP